MAAAACSEVRGQEQAEFFTAVAPYEIAFANPSRSARTTPAARCRLPRVVLCH